jgi:hypothetical protein
VVRDSFQRTWRSRRRCDPYQEDRINIFEARIERLGNREIPRTTSICGRKAAASGLRLIVRNRAPVALN